MPLYMDFHMIPNITIEDAMKAHLADEAIQKKYGVKYIRFWLNEKAGNIFCLVEGPDQKTCETVHKLAHGHLACAIVEVDPGYESLIMGANLQIDGGLVRDATGAADHGYRTILALQLMSESSAKSMNFVDSKTFKSVRDQVADAVVHHHGRAIHIPGDDCMLSVFNTAQQALLCAKDIQKKLHQINTKLKKGEGKFSFGIGVGAGQPVTINNEFIEETIRLARRLSTTAQAGQILITPLVTEFSEDKILAKDKKKLKALAASEESFLTQLFTIIEDRIADESLSVESLVTALGISRPQLYRRVRDLSGKAPNDLIRDFRLDKAYSLLKRRSGNIAEVAFEVGFAHPSYFAKCFAKRFGFAPSQLVSSK